MMSHVTILNNVCVITGWFCVFPTCSRYRLST